MHANEFVKSTLRGHETISTSTAYLKYIQKLNKILNLKLSKQDLDPRQFCSKDWVSILRSKIFTMLNKRINNNPTKIVNKFSRPKENSVEYDRNLDSTRFNMTMGVESI
jgi:hypothetical protein